MKKSEHPEKSKYSETGVDSRGAESSLSGLLKHVLPTREFNPRYPTRINIGYFANVVDFGNGVGVAFSTDGVGTKVIVAELMDKYDTIGIDCVAMNANDVLCVGARPVSMVDYIGCSFTDERIFEALGKGLAEGARQAGIGISGGEISQVREIINGIDLIGACIGHVRTDQINTGKDIRPGNLIVGLASTGVHSNGLTLARRALLGATREEQKARARQFSPELGRSIGDELLEPTRIYVQVALEMMDSGIDLKALAHITSGGFCNLNRVEKDDIRFVIDSLQPIPAVFALIQEQGPVEDAEMFEVFNMGTGFCVVVENPGEADAVLAICRKHGVPSQVIGYVEGCHGKEVAVPEKKLVGRGQKFLSS
ncbi:MAG: phosphoribosylformylglycinamidine cyclo-ligase [Nitrospinae bacterium]|nr:phosphoribosylformylglycinamidine cyclo-ligase [Nitrospinota bacterium]